jgi:hypothetical protein
MILIITYIYVFMVLSTLVMLGIYLYNRQQEQSKNNLEFRKRMDIAEIKDDDRDRKLDRIIYNIDSLTNKVTDNSIRISKIERKNPLK